MPIIVKSCLNLSKLRPKYYQSLFPDTVYFFLFIFSASFMRNKLVKTLYRYDPRSDSWTTVSAISRPRDAVGLCGLGDRLYAVGGCDDDQRYVAVVECYDTLNNRWTPVTYKNLQLRLQQLTI